MKFPVETVIDGEKITSIIFIMIFATVILELVIKLVWSVINNKLNERQRAKKLSPIKDYSPNHKIIFIMTFVLMAFIIFNTKDNFNIHKTNIILDSEESSLRLLDGEIDVLKAFEIRNDALVYNYKNENDMFQSTKELGTFEIEDEVATLAPTNLLGITFVRYGNYVQDNLEIKPEQTLNKIDVENETIDLIIYDETFETYETETFDAE